MEHTKRKRAIILMYHQLIPNDAPGNWTPNDLADPYYGVREQVFREHLSLFRRTSLPVIDLDHYLSEEASREDPPLSIIISFDDGYQSDLALAGKALVTAGFPAIFFLSTARLGGHGMMTPEQARELALLPRMRIGAHGATHRFLTDLTDKELEGELQDAKLKIQEWSGEKNIYISAPGGRINSNAIRKVMEAGYKGLLTSNPGAYIKGGDPFFIPRLPVTNTMSVKQLESLLDPDSFSFQANRWIRTGRRLVREWISSPPLSRKKP
ncbi:polysaccharide deacetylase family protein [Leptospirillum ferrooxidans]|uniref:Putative polysaccharide deacetylase n=1 Tax=Leptospirillum ferrooxidans (strain C2-3) TaxID=1162668 RepID=I0IRM6_LEPFC|nr:polysaccharide deacetylase family protein [Leptospirillum ferrooxidans]BAM07925.1 putative polysaccharide deacetylase [Leptospirillum ferrooxidans C2-3]